MSNYIFCGYCGEEIKVNSNSTHIAEVNYNIKTYGFCSLECMSKKYGSDTNDTDK